MSICPSNIFLTQPPEGAILCPSVCPPNCHIFFQHLKHLNLKNKNYPLTNSLHHSTNWQPKPILHLTHTHYLFRLTLRNIVRIFALKSFTFYILILVFEVMQSHSWKLVNRANSFCASWYWVVKSTCLTLNKPSVSKTGNLDWCSQISSITSISASFEAIVPLSGIFLLTRSRATKALLEGHSNVMLYLYAVFFF